MKFDDLTEEQCGLVFNVMRSARYHDRRCAHFEFLHRITSVATILTSGLALAELLKTALPEALVALAAATAVLATFDLVVGYSRTADLHRTFKRRFNCLEQDVWKAIKNSNDLSDLHHQRLEIEKEEPPIFRALDLQIHNELMFALGYDPKDPKAGFVQIPLLLRLSAQWLKWPNAFQKAMAHNH